MARNSELETQKVLRSNSPENLTSPHLSWVFRTPRSPYLPHVPPISEPRSPHLSGCLPALAIRKLLLISTSMLIMELQQDEPEESMEGLTLGDFSKKYDYQGRSQKIEGSG